MRIRDKCKAILARTPVRQRQWLAAGALCGGGYGIFWLLMAMSSSPAQTATSPTGQRSKVVVNTENVGTVNPMQVSPVDQWLGTAGKELAQYRTDREAQDRINAERKATEDALMKRLADLEKDKAEVRSPVPVSPPSAPMPAAQPAPMSGAPAMESTSSVTAPLTYPPPVVGLRSPPGLGAPLPAMLTEEAPALVRVSVGSSDVTVPAAAPAGAAGAAPLTLDNYLPVGILKGRLMSGLSAPTGGQAQGNPLPVMILLEDDAVLANRFQAPVKECLVIASAYGDISSERAYMRTATLSCVRPDRSVLEVAIKGNVFGEDGGVGVRGRLVTKQGQLLANALRAGIVSGIGQGFSAGGATFTSSPLGTLVTSPEGMSEQMRRGVAGGFGRALDNLANYYIKLAEQTFPVIEVDASRLVDVVLTEGVRLPATWTGRFTSNSIAEAQEDGHD